MALFCGGARRENSFDFQNVNSLVNYQKSNLVMYDDTLNSYLEHWVVACKHLHFERKSSVVDTKQRWNNIMSELNMR